ncbi:UDP-N-acetylglucosamine 1-carboxyvinyltransferase 2 [Clostridia bacterium]|nr:UDP-N-acetylglucosamine 1-carboxyvinyltransferase 2 [Clostridia bacterium]
MGRLVITGGKPLIGEVTVSGSKNAAVAIIPAAILAKGECIIENLPKIDDIVSYIESLKNMGVTCEFVDEHTLKIDSTNVRSICSDSEAVKKIRASYYLVGVNLGLFNKAEVALPGGCNLGTRPYDLHLKGFAALGAAVDVKHGKITAFADKLTGSVIYLDTASVGATINIMLAAVLADGSTVIENAAKEPHIVDTANFLSMLGANIKGAGTSTIKITGVQSLSGGKTYAVIPDQIEAGTFMIAAAVTGGSVKVTNIIPQHMDSLSAKLSEMNCEVTSGDNWIKVDATKRPITAVNLKTMVYPGFPTDLQPQMCALLSAAEGTSLITETIYENRFQYVNELKRLGANVTVDGRLAVINGPSRLTGAPVTATDLRAGAALVVAGLAAEGETVIDNLKYIDRGYEHIEDKLRDLGATISRIDTEDLA